MAVTSLSIAGGIGLAPGSSCPAGVSTGLGFGGLCAVSYCTPSSPLAKKLIPLNNQEGGIPRMGLACVPTPFLQCVHRCRLVLCFIVLDQ